LSAPTKVLAALAAEPTVLPEGARWHPTDPELTPGGDPVAAGLLEAVAGTDLSGLDVVLGPMEVSGNVVIDGDEGPVRMAYWITRREDLDREAFRCHWHEVHAPIVRQIPELVRYVQSSAVGEEDDGFDGVAELWWPDADAYRRDFATAEVRAAYADERNFIDHGRVAVIVTRR
jgi:uncharacterized protein (TIGR02118 family)